MSHEPRDTYRNASDPYGIYRKYIVRCGQGSAMGLSTLIGKEVHSQEASSLGDIKEIMLDMRSGKIAYAVLAFGGLFGIGEKLLAVPWRAMKLDTVTNNFVISIAFEQLKNAPCFDKSNWPDMSDPLWVKTIDEYYQPRH